MSGRRAESWYLAVEKNCLKDYKVFLYCLQTLSGALKLPKSPNRNDCPQPQQNDRWSGNIWELNKLSLNGHWNSWIGAQWLHSVCTHSLRVQVQVGKTHGTFSSWLILIPLISYWSASLTLWSVWLPSPSRLPFGATRTRRGLRSRWPCWPVLVTSGYGHVECVTSIWEKMTKIMTNAIKL